MLASYLFALEPNLSVANVISCENLQINSTSMKLPSRRKVCVAVRVLSTSHLYLVSASSANSVRPARINNSI